ncbi:hypothetical protein BofuT4_P062770.1 [Botrytis cinerea T4]|uniref:Alcohol dehydrogenase-like N-terminal domain-containing protein n=1 Tax=Botryotinia fuckeliana (strain T4) TaxID=999810 RepID=G2XTL1_BOTF4|nr:hypothetical protein BofuT4_P062770.1 [Botrytis cinerea T4]
MYLDDLPNEQVNSLNNLSVKASTSSQLSKMENLPKEQWAQVVEETGKPVVYKKIPVQKPGADEVLVNIKFSGVCHTDLHAVNGDWPLDTKLPLVGGHEGAGVVVAVGSLVEDVKVGDYAGVKVSYFCPPSQMK